MDIGGHGIPQADVHRLFSVARRFFALPAEEKLAIEMINSPQFRGYTRVAGELTRGQPDWREQPHPDVARRHYADLLETTTG